MTGGAWHGRAHIAWRRVFYFYFIEDGAALLVWNRREA